MNQAPLIESVWTILPFLILISIAIPTISYLLKLDVGGLVGLVVKVVGHQWYWSYFYEDIGIQVDSYMVPYRDLKLGDLNLLKTDRPCVVPFGIKLKFLVTRGDVIHSWAVPSLGIKVDAIAGINSRVRSFVEFPSIYWGMCRELCGSYHSYMPINVEATSRSLFKEWINLNL